MRCAADIWKDSLLWSKYSSQARCLFAGQSEYRQRKCHFATFKILSHQMSIRCGQSFVKANFKLFPFYFFQHSFHCWPKNIDVSISSRIVWHAHARQNTHLIWKIKMSMLLLCNYKYKLFGIFLPISHIIAEIVLNSLVWLLSCFRVCKVIDYVVY